MKIFTKEEIEKAWANGTIIKYNNKSYTVHKMNYGDYFLELSNKKSRETDPFTDDEIWLIKKIINNKICYAVEK